jgi:hypothetical protein
LVRALPAWPPTAVGGNIKVENAWLNIIGATPPSWLQINFPASLLGEGIGSRIIFIYGDHKRHLTAYPSQTPRAATYAIMEKELLEDLVEISKIIGEYDLTADAYKWGTDWYGKHAAMRNPSFASGRYSGYLARKQTHLHKLAMVLAAAKRDALIIEKDDLIEAEAILAGAERSMIRVFENMGLVDEAKHIAELVNFVKAHQWITAKDLYRLCYNIIAQKDFTALKIAIDGNLLEVTLSAAASRRRPQSPRRQLRPATSIVASGNKFGRFARERDVALLCRYPDSWALSWRSRIIIDFCTVSAPIALPRA